MPKTKWYKTSTGKAALAGVVPTALISIIALVIQTCLTVKQFERDTDKDKGDSVRTIRKERSDSVRQAKINFTDSIRSKKVFTYDSLLRTNQNYIAKSQLSVFNHQLYMQKKELSRDGIRQLFKLDDASNQLLQLLLTNTFYAYTYGSDKNEIAYLKQIEAVLDGQITNPTLIENKKLHQEWNSELSLIRIRLFESGVENLNSLSPAAVRDTGAVAGVAARSRYSKRQLIYDKMSRVANETQKYCKKEIPKQISNYSAKFPEKY